MARVEDKETIELLSRWQLGVMVGGFVAGFGGVAVYRYEVKKPTRIGLYPQTSNDTQGVVFGYNQTARVFIDEKLRWVNRVLPNAPQGRQDIWNEQGMVKLEMFKEEELMRFLEEERETLKALGLVENNNK